MNDTDNPLFSLAECHSAFRMKSWQIYIYISFIYTLAPTGCKKCSAGHIKFTTQKCHSLYIGDIYGWQPFILPSRMLFCQAERMFANLYISFIYNLAPLDCENWFAVQNIFVTQRCHSLYIRDIYMTDNCFDILHYKNLVFKCLIFLCFPWQRKRILYG